MFAGCGTGTTHLHRGETSRAKSGRDVADIVVVTYNVQDLYVGGRDRRRRMRLLGSTLATLDPDVVAIQEAFIERDRDELLAQLGDGRLQHHAYFGHGTAGSGLLVLSALPILETAFHRFENRGKWYKLWEGDYWAGKGTALVRISLGEGVGVLDFYNIHAQASYVKQGSFDANAPVRLEQMAELRDFVLRTSRPDNPVILAGDFNCRQGSEDYQFLVEGVKLKRLLTVATEWDHIFAMEKSRWNCQATPTRVLTSAKDPDAENEEVRLSDHDGYLAKITITRKEEAER